ncbi:cache domain-containing protein [Helicobacter felistomachi]|uniref:cache domain-containing protein n=1 Tax=Helicobacter felistomachi TaxID=3040201 RepID=UPI00336ABC81
MIVLIIVTLLLFARSNHESVERVNILVSRDLKDFLGEKIKLATNVTAYNLARAIEGAKDDATRRAIVAHMLGNFRYEQDHSGYFFVYQKYTPFYSPNNKGGSGDSDEYLKDKNGVYYMQELYKVLDERWGFCELHLSKALARWRHKRHA